MYTLLHGAKKNAGDFLIFKRAREIVSAYRKTEDFLILPRWESVEQHLDMVNRSEALIICGGPGYSADFYPGTYPLTPDLSQIKVPIVPLAVGWSGKPNGNVDTFKFTPESIMAIREIHTRIPNSSVRDVLTEKVVKSAGVDNVLMTGCVAWYYLPMVEQGYEPPKDIKRVVVSTPARVSNFTQAKGLVDLVRGLFPKAKKYLVFHRGMFPDKHTNAVNAGLNMTLAAYGKLRGYEVINAAFGTEKLEFYQNCDFHIGYRVHAHLDFLSYRRASVLIQEDGRGLGQSMSLGTEDVAGDDPNALNKIETIIQTHRDNNFENFHRVIQKMRDTHQVMKSFIESF